MSFGNRTGNVEETLLHLSLFSVVSWVPLKSHLGILDVYLYIDGNRCVRIHAYIRAFGRKESGNVKGNRRDDGMKKLKSDRKTFKHVKTLHL